MLCYQSRRSAIDIIHDAIKWLTDNRRMVGLVLVLMLPAMFYALIMVTSPSFDYDRWDRGFFDGIFYTIERIFAVKDPWLRIWGFGPLAFCMGMVLSSQLSRYFYRRHTVRDASFRSIFRSLGRGTWRWVLCGLATALIAVFSNFFLLVLMLIVGGFFIPPLIMHTSYGSEFLTDIWLKIKTLFFVVMIIAVVILLPMFMGGLIFTALAWFNEIMPVMQNNNETINDVTNIIIYCGVLVSYCLGIAIWITSMLILYGSINSDEN